MRGYTYQGEDISSAWASYFESLATPSNQHYDESFNAKYESLPDLPMNDFIPFTEEEVDEAVHTLKLDKAAGPDGTEPEHLVFGGRLLVQHLTCLFNAIVLSGHIPPVFQQGHQSQKATPRTYPIPQTIEGSQSSPILARS